MHLAFDIFQGIGIALSVGIRPFLPSLAIGALADHVGIQHSFVIPMICYLYIAYYGLVGSKPARTVTA